MAGSSAASSGASSLDGVVQKVGEKGSVTLHYPMLTETNYAVWALKMRVNLQAQGVWEAVKNREVEEHLDRMALAAIFQAVPENMLPMLGEKDSAKEAWETLQTMHLGAERIREAKIQTLRSDFEVVRMKDDESIDEFAMRLTTIVTSIHSLGVEVEVVVEGVAVVEIQTNLNETLIHRKETKAM